MESAVFQRLKKSRPKRLLSAPLSRHSPSAPGYCKFYGLMVDPFAGCDLINSSACRLRLISIKTRVSSLTRVNLCVRRAWARSRICRRRALLLTRFMPSLHSKPSIPVDRGNSSSAIPRKAHHLHALPHPCRIRLSGIDALLVSPLLAHAL